MSKISLEPNASGAGTFTLAAPNSNTNRTLTLPDEAGKVLSTGNNDPAEIFKQSNILGTVSESGGVPTGAIIERGSNANGDFIKYADGTMICYIREPASGYIGSTSTGGGTIQGIAFTRSRRPISTFPATFSNTDDLTVNVEVYQTSTGSSNPIPIWAVTDGSRISDNGIRTQLIGLGGSSTFNSDTDFDGSRLFGTGITIIGRWY